MPMDGVETATAATARVAVSSATRLSSRSSTDGRRRAGPALLPVPAQDRKGSPLRAPTGLTSEVSHDSVILSGDDSGDDTITGYVILRRDKASHPQGTFETIKADTGSADTTYRRQHSAGAAVILPDQGPSTPTG